MTPENRWMAELFNHVSMWSENKREFKATLSEWFATGEIVDTDYLAGLEEEQVKQEFQVQHFNPLEQSFITNWDFQGYCLCGHWIIYHVVIENILNGNRLFVGTECIKRFETANLNVATAEELNYVAYKITEFKCNCQREDTNFTNIMTKRLLEFINKYNMLDIETQEKLMKIGCGSAICVQYELKCNVEDLMFLIQAILTFIMKVARKKKFDFDYHSIIAKIVLENTNWNIKKEWFEYIKKNNIPFKVDINKSVNLHVRCLFNNFTRTLHTHIKT